MCHMTHPKKKTMKTIRTIIQFKGNPSPGPCSIPSPVISLRHWHSSFILYLNHPHVNLFLSYSSYAGVFSSLTIFKSTLLLGCVPKKLVPPPLPDPTKPLEVRNYSRYSFPSFSTDPSFICILLFPLHRRALGKVSTNFQM